MPRQTLIYTAPYTAIGIHNGAEFRTRLLEVVCNAEAAVIVDLSSVQTIDSYGFGILMLTARTLPHHTRMVIVWNPEGEGLARSIKAERILPIVRSVESAHALIRSWTENPSADEVLVPTTV